jgi:hypothetical protein
MKKEFIAYEQALELKELGFDEPCFGRYDGRDENKGKIWYEMPNLGKGWIPVEDVLAPLYQQAFRWLHEQLGMKGLMPSTDLEYRSQMLNNLIKMLSSKKKKHA